MQKAPFEPRERAYDFSIDIISFCKALPDTRIYWTVSNQLLRSATSVGANLMEAKGSSTKKDFIRFYSIALKSGNETLYWLSLLRDSELDSYDASHLNDLIKECEEICKIIGKSIVTMKKNTG